MTCCILLPFDPKLNAPNVLYRKYKDIRQWLSVNQIPHRFHWDDTGQYYPTSISMAADDDALAFRLTFGV